MDLSDPKIGLSDPKSSLISKMKPLKPRCLSDPQSGLSDPKSGLYSPKAGLIDLNSDLPDPKSDILAPKISFSKLHLSKFPPPRPKSLFSALASNEAPNLASQTSNQAHWSANQVFRRMENRNWRKLPYVES